MDEKRIKIGFLGGDLKDPYTRHLINGARNAAEEYDVDLVIVPGKYYGAESFHDKYEYQYNALYSFENNRNMDALVIMMGAIGPFSPDPNSRNYFQRFIDKFRGIPVVSIATEVSGWSCIKYDNYEAIKEGIHYLVHEQNCRKIGMVSGEMSSEDGIERLNAYKEGLLEEDIEIDESLIVYGDFTYRSRGLIKEFIDSHRYLDAIVFANDRMAKEGYIVMKELGLKVGSDIAFLGFDDTPEAVKMDPPLASIKADATALGYESIKLAIKSSQMKVTREVILPSRLFIRESLNKMGDEKLGKGGLSSENDFFTGHNFYKNSEEIFEHLFEKCALNSNYDIAYQLYEPVVKNIAELFNNRNLREEDFTSFRENFIALLEEGSKYNMDSSKLLRVTDVVMKKIEEQQESESSKLVVSRYTARIFRRIFEVFDHRAHKMAADKMNMVHTSNTVSKSMFIFTSGSEQNYRNIMENLSQLGINHSFLFLLEQPVINLINDDFKAPDYFYLKAVQNGNDVSVPATTAQKVSIFDLYDHCSELNGGERLDLTMIDLFCDEEQYGILLCDIPFENYDYAEEIMFQASNAIRMLSLLRNRQDVQEQLENSLALLKKNNIELDYLSKSDELTSIYNRRGFYTESQKLLDSRKSKGKLIFVIYADTDNLKIINDRYGHDDGDYALSVCSKILTEVFGENAIVGRIGGDEFAVIVVAEDVSASEKYKRSIKKALKKVNDESDKPYLVNMSVGITVVKHKEGLELKELLEKADALLYKEKIRHKKEIGKQDIEKAPKE